MDRPVLGQRVRASDRLIRREYYASGPYEKRWERHGSIQVFKDKPVEGVFVGFRTLSNGIVDYGGGYPEWYPKEYLEAWLVAFDPRSNPVYVLPIDTEILDD